MDEITTIGIDLAKSVFQLHGVDADAHAAFDLLIETFEAKYPKATETRSPNSRTASPLLLQMKNVEVRF